MCCLCVYVCPCAFLILKQLGGGLVSACGAEAAGYVVCECVCKCVCVQECVCVCVCVNTKTLGDGLVTACGAEVATDVRFVGVYE